MKKILFAFLLICSFWNYGIGQIQYTGCNGAISAGYPITLNLAGNDGTRNFYVNTLPGTPCSAGTCAFRVIWTGSQWEIQLSTNGGASYPNTLYVNTSASLPDPPDLTLGTWVPQGPCAGQAISTWTGNVQSTVSTCSNPTVPTITSTPTSICAGSSTTLTISGTLNDATNWHIYTGTCGGTQIGMTSTSSFVVNPSVNTTYFVRGEDGAGCVNEATGLCGSVMVTVNAIPGTPTISAGSATTFCSGGSVMLTSSASAGNQWMLNGSSIGGATNQTYSATAGGNYTVTSTVNGCTSASSSATSVTVNTTPNAPTLTPAGSATICSGNSVTLTSSAAVNQWFLNGSVVAGNGQTYIATAAGSYTATALANGCTSSPSAATVVTVNAMPVPAITTSATTICTGDSVTLTSSESTGNQWIMGGSPITGATNQTLVVTAGGIYLTEVTRINGCTGNSNSISINVLQTPNTPTISAGGSTTFCSGGSVMLTSSATTGNQWMLNGNPIGGATNQTYSATAGGNYTVTSTVNGCTSASSLATSVTVNTTPNAPTLNPAGSTTICSGNSVTLTSSAAVNQWFLNGSVVAGNGQTYIATAAGSYTATALANGCTSSPSAATVVTVNATPMPVITASATTICSGDSVTLTSSESMGNQWAVNGGLILGGNNQTLVVTTGGIYIAQVTINGCAANSNPISINVLQTPNTPTISAGGSTTFCTGDSVMLTSSATTGNQWLLNGSPIIGATIPSFLVTTGGSYTVEVTGNGCTSAASTATVVTVNPNPITPSILAGSSTTFCTGDSVILNTITASTGNQWMLNGSPIGGATNQTYSATTAGNYSVEFTMNGCSSTSAVLAVSVNSTATNSQTLVECAGTMVSIGSNVYTTSGTYTDTLTAANGCDSILTTTLTILSPVDTSITTTLPTLTANASGASYQWVDCDSSYTPVAGATGQAYTPTANGNYAVIITDGNCSDTSSCYAVIITGIKNNKLTKMLTLFPNPTSGNLSIELGQIFEEVTIRVINVAGQELSTKSFESTNQIDFNLEGTPGVYLLEVTTNEGDTTTIKVLKK